MNFYFLQTVLSNWNLSDSIQPVQEMVPHSTHPIFQRQKPTECNMMAFYPIKQPANNILSPWTKARNNNYMYFYKSCQTTNTNHNAGYHETIKNYMYIYYLKEMKFEH